jgi:hypothetical protein
MLTIERYWAGGARLTLTWLQHMIALNRAGFFSSSILSKSTCVHQDVAACNPSCGMC